MAGTPVAFIWLINQLFLLLVDRTRIVPGRLESFSLNKSVPHADPSSSWGPLRAPGTLLFALTKAFYLYFDKNGRVANRRVFPPRQMLADLKGRDGEVSVEGDFIMEEKIILAVRTRDGLIAHPQDLNRVALLGNSIVFFVLSVCGLAMPLVFLPSFSGLFPDVPSRWPTLAAITTLATATVLSLIFSLSLGWLRANALAARVERLLEQSSGNRQAGERPLVNICRGDRRPYVWPARLVVGLFLAGILFLGLKAGYR